MKTFKKLFCLAVCLCFLFACSDYEENLIGDLKSGHLGSHNDGDIKVVTKPFKVDFMGTYQPYGERCPINVLVDGVGTGTHVGNCIVHFDFCIGPFSNDSSYYGDTFAYIVAANGDSLFVSIAGAVVSTPLEDHPEYVVSYFRDPFEILGGTGRFEGASGGGMSDDYNHVDYPGNSFHQWEGTITLKKGKIKEGKK